MHYWRFYGLYKIECYFHIFNAYREYVWDREYGTKQPARKYNSGMENWNIFGFLLHILLNIAPVVYYITSRYVSLEREYYRLHPDVSIV